MWIIYKPQWLSDHASSSPSVKWSLGKSEVLPWMVFPNAFGALNTNPSRQVFWKRRLKPLKIAIFEKFRAKHWHQKVTIDLCFLKWAKLIACILRVEWCKRKRNTLRRSLKINQFYLKIVTQRFFGLLITDLHAYLTNSKWRIQLIGWGL